MGDGELQSDEGRAIRVDLQGFTPRQYAVLILRDELDYSWAKCGIKLNITRYAARELYKRAKLK
jgi:DNA-directed RNA polymerase specialized sigma24 family protein